MSQRFNFNPRRFVVGFTWSGASHWAPTWRELWIGVGPFAWTLTWRCHK